MFFLRKGFTLVEILITLALIGIFIGTLSYWNSDSRIAQTKAERLANSIHDTIHNARNDSMVGRGVLIGNTLTPTIEREISINGTQITTIYATSTSTGLETSIQAPFYDDDQNYVITDISVSSGILVSGIMPIWDQVGVSSASIKILNNGDLKISSPGIVSDINIIRITAGYNGSERSVILNRLSGNSEVVTGRGEQDYTPPPPPVPIDGMCDNLNKFRCITGNPDPISPGACGGSATWSCLGINGGANATGCIKQNPDCVVAPPSNSCNTTLPSCNGTSCSLTYAPTSVNQSWTKDAPNCGYACTGGYTGANCEVAPAPTPAPTTDPVNGSCNPTFNSATTPTPTCATGTPTAISGNGPWTWGCDSTNGGTNTVTNACTANKTINCVGSWGSCSSGSQTYSISTPAANGGAVCETFDGNTRSCGTPAVCDNTTQFACTSGTSVSNVAGSCGGSSTWGCNSTDGGTSTAPTACTKMSVACTCNDGIKNQGEEVIDCGGPNCSACAYVTLTGPSGVIDLGAEGANNPPSISLSWTSTNAIVCQGLSGGSSDFNFIGATTGNKTITVPENEWWHWMHCQNAAGKWGPMVEYRSKACYSTYPDIVVSPTNGGPVYGMGPVMNGSNFGAAATGLGLLTTNNVSKQYAIHRTSAGYFGNYNGGIMPGGVQAQASSSTDKRCGINITCATYDAWGKCVEKLP